MCGMPFNPVIDGLCILIQSSDLNESRLNVPLKVWSKSIRQPKDQSFSLQGLTLLWDQIRLWWDGGEIPDGWIKRQVCLLGWNGLLYLKSNHKIPAEGKQQLVLKANLNLELQPMGDQNLCLQEMVIWFSSLPPFPGQNMTVRHWGPIAPGRWGKLDPV